MVHHRASINRHAFWLESPRLLTQGAPIMLQPVPAPSESLVRVLEAGLQVRRRPQFFIWTQGDLQRWVPHALMVSGVFDHQQGEMVMDVFNSVPLAESLVDALRQFHSPLMGHLRMVQGQANGRPARVPVRALVEFDPRAERLRQAGFEELMIHGLHRAGLPDEAECLFIVARPGHGYTSEAVTAFDMLLPSLQRTSLHVLDTERDMAPARYPMVGREAAARPASITAREREILLWVRNGLSNHQIATKLGISALTVKNHVQKILRKLGAANRAQAVAKAMSMRVVGGVPEAGLPS